VEFWCVYFSPFHRSGELGQSYTKAKLSPNTVQIAELGQSYTKAKLSPNTVQIAELDQFIPRPNYLQRRYK